MLIGEFTQMGLGRNFTSSLGEDDLVCGDADSRETSCGTGRPWPWLRGDARRGEPAVGAELVAMTSDLGCTRGEGIAESSSKPLEQLVVSSSSVESVGRSAGAAAPSRPWNTRGKERNFTFPLSDPRVQLAALSCRSGWKDSRHGTGGEVQEEQALGRCICVWTARKSTNTPHRPAAEAE